MAFILATNGKKETHFDYNAEDDTIEQWFSNFSLLWTPFSAPKTATDPEPSPEVVNRGVYVCAAELYVRPGGA